MTRCFILFMLSLSFGLSPRWLYSKSLHVARVDTMRFSICEGDCVYVGGGTTKMPGTYTYTDWKSDTIVAIVTVHPLPNPGFTIDSSVSGKITFMALEPIGTGVEYKWDINQVAVSTQQALVLSSFPAGMYLVALQVTTRYHCIALQQRWVQGPVTGIQESGQPRVVVSIRPNPVSSMVSIYFEKECTGEITLYDDVGKQCVKERITSREMRMDLAELKAGIYFLHATTDEGVEKIKLAKQ